MEIRSETFGKGDIAKLEWDESYFKYCEFRDCAIEGQVINADFVSCSFTGIDWYWILFNVCNLIGCEFRDCVFQGCAFPDSRFVDCKFANCQFVEDNLGVPCDFTKTASYGCTLNNTKGFIS